MKIIKTFESYTKRHLEEWEEVAYNFGITYDELMISLTNAGCSSEIIEDMEPDINKIILYRDPLEIHVLMEDEGIVFGLSENGQDYVAKFKNINDLAQHIENTEDYDSFCIEI